MVKEKSLIQLAVEQVYEAAETEMDEIISLQSEHGKCYNYFRVGDDDIWVFQDGYRHHIKREK